MQAQTNYRLEIPTLSEALKGVATGIANQHAEEDMPKGYQIANQSLLQRFESKGLILPSCQSTVSLTQSELMPP